MIIYGSKPMSFPVGQPQNRDTLREVYGKWYKGQEIVVPEGMVLVVKEHGGWESPKETRHQFPSGTKFKVLNEGSPYELAKTEIML